MTHWPYDPEGDLTPILKASIEAAKLRHPSGKTKEPSMVTEPSEWVADQVNGGENVLTAADRCDACGASAVYRMAKEVDSPSALDYCLHHWRKYVPQMSGWVVIGANVVLAAAIGGEGS